MEEAALREALEEAGVRGVLKVSWLTFLLTLHSFLCPLG